jgi:hypothetical protein
MLITRFLYSSANDNLRKLSSFKTAYRANPVTFVLVHVTYLHILIRYTITPNLFCQSQSTPYGAVLGIGHVFAYGIGPPSLMLLFFLLTIRNVRRQRIRPSIPYSNQTTENSRKDKHLVPMAFVQCLLVGLTTTSYAATQLYITSISNQVKSRLQIAVDTLFTLIFGSISAIGHSTTFFVFTLSSKMFCQHLMCKHQERM